jgi:predicted MPP superfamily phosphohydrolase
VKVTTLCDFEVMKQKTPLNYRSTTQQIALKQKASSLNEKKIVEVLGSIFSQFWSAKTEDWVQFRIQHKKLTLHNIIDIKKKTQDPKFCLA